MAKFVNNEDLLKAYMRWEEAAPLLLRGPGEWERFLGFPDGYSGAQPEARFHRIAWEIPDIGAERVRMLCDSPHWRTMLKVMAIKEAAAMFE